MKKLIFAFALIALVANVGNAATIDILVNDQAYTGQDVVASDIITVIWVNDETYKYGGFGSFLMNVSAGDFVPDSGWTYPGLALGSVTDTVVGDGFDVLITGSQTYPELPLEPMASFDFHVGADLEPSTDIIIDPYQGSWVGTYAAVGGDDSLPYVVLHVGIPEPATICLLGLGALSLIRRRRKA